MFTTQPSNAAKPLLSKPCVVGKKTCLGPNFPADIHFKHWASNLEVQHWKKKIRTPPPQIHLQVPRLSASNSGIGGIVIKLNGLFKEPSCQPGPNASLRLHTGDSMYKKDNLYHGDLATFFVCFVLDIGRNQFTLPKKLDRQIGVPPNLVTFQKKQTCHHFHGHIGVSKNGGTPKWMVYNGKPY